VCHFLRICTLFVIAAVMGLSAVAEEAPTPHYRLLVSAEPATHKFEVEAWIQAPPASRFYLYKGFKVASVEADGKRVSFHPDLSAPALPLGPASAAIVVDAPGGKQLHIKYGGEMPETVAGVNTVSADLVELAIYSGWFPVFKGVSRYDYEMELNLPEAFVAATNGELKSQRVEKGRSITSWASFKPGFDIAIVASPRLKKTEREINGTHVEIYATSAIPATVLKDEMEGLAEEMRQLTILYGEPSIKGFLRIIYSPRDGWGYARIPVSIVSEGRARYQLIGEAGEAREFRENAHEVAHFWWAFTGVESFDNWIDEGLAEYSAFRMTSDRYGIGFNFFQVGQYQRRIKTAKLTYAIAKTPSNTLDREINRYDKAAIMFLEAEQRFGRTSLDKALRAVRARFISGTPATTANFLDEIEKQMGKEAAAYFREELYRKPTNEPALKPAGN